MSTRVAEDDLLSAAVGDPTRRKLLDALLERGAATATTLADDVPVSRQAITKHLATLDRVGLVARERKGREVRFTVRPERLDSAAASMARVAEQWDRRLLRIKRMAETLRTSAATTKTTKVAK